MNKVIHSALVLLVALGVTPAVHSQSDSKAVQEAELRFSIEMTSALNNNAEAQFRVAEMYEKGLGIPQNLRVAHMWYLKSANQGYAPAIKRLINWDGEKQQAEPRPRERPEEQKRRQAEADAAAAKAARERAEEKKRRQAEADAAAAKAARERAEEQKRRQVEADAAAAKARSAQATEAAHAPKEKPAEPDHSKNKAKVTPDQTAEKRATEFRANPCQTPTAKFTSTCQ